jgi:hypothetical protein
MSEDGALCRGVVSVASLGGVVERASWQSATKKAAHEARKQMMTGTLTKRTRWMPLPSQHPM